MKALIIGASGILGSQIVGFLSKEINIKAGFRDKTKFIEKENVESVYFDYEDEESIDLSLQGIDRVLLMAPPLDFGSYEKLSVVVKKMKNLGIKKVVLISALGVDSNDEIPLRKVELDLIKDDFDYVILRPNYFMESFSSGAFASFKQTNELALCAGDGQTSFISAVDIAKIVTKVILEDKYNKKAFNLTGNEALSMGEAINIINEIKKTNYKYNDVQIDKFKEILLSYGINESNIDFSIMLLTHTKNGYLSGITNDVKEILGTEPKSFREFVKEYI
ncbi:NAD(P)H-binding protein [Aliarcobacter butzleri]|uniref:NAD(P)H-binding protein n=2 Tax=Aliarcobacter butzleri TaxID=28197 RepID=UPI001EDA4805|nr:NAD(P)H-binding protein [Aliarcobacter butzleri]MCG3656673.1 NAD(P)H-binding protein [Aliarcobacter butzleri]MCG3706099.1 NAD(P)H-binding protein [Aliarcobacter butzleri]MCG3710520.1 NAD(P)H-binding protein [Aliarcobacter butzleri]MCG3714951.1 NAD(P)H-binding protein [Aliarcobacter butzleri]MCT7537513.1 NAD(P)H-binding protein [Aliarcobacter butzleri]